MGRELHNMYRANKNRPTYANTPLPNKNRKAEKPKNARPNHDAPRLTARAKTRPGSRLRPETNGL